MSLLGMIINQIIHDAQNHQQPLNKYAILSSILAVVLWFPVDVWLKILTTCVIVFSNIPNLFRGYDAIRERLNNKKSDKKEDAGSNT
jgi:hypothetical protein